MDCAKQLFWDERILAWEASKYSMAFYEKFDLNRSLKARMKRAIEILSPIAHEKTLTELGCASARLLESLFQPGVGLKKYIGVDFSKNAIDEAWIRAKRLGVQNRVELHCANAIEIQPIDTDICLSLGFVDWLNKWELEKLASRIHSPYQLHSFSEIMRMDLRRWMHWIYMGLVKKRPQDYRARYLRPEEVQKSFPLSGSFENRFQRFKDMSFCTFWSNIPSTPVT